VQVSFIRCEAVAILGRFAHICTGVRVLTKIREKCCPLVKLYRSVGTNGNEFHRDRLIIERGHKCAPVSLIVSSKTLKHQTKFSHKLTDNSERSFLYTAFATDIPPPLQWTNRFCESYGQGDYN
jgi:hypothetical protein